MRGSLIDAMQENVIPTPHTPGIWHTRGSKHGVAVYSRRGDTVSELLAVVRFLGENNAEGIANGRMFAAAPALRDACIVALTHLTCGGDKERAVNKLCLALDLADGVLLSQSRESFGKEQMVTGLGSDPCL